MPSFIPVIIKKELAVDAYDQKFDHRDDLIDAALQTLNDGGTLRSGRDTDNLIERASLPQKESTLSGGKLTLSGSAQQARRLYPNLYNSRLKQ